MAWIRKDDGWRGHEKMRHAIYLAGSGREGRQVKWLWDEALSECCEHRLDGIIAAYRLPEIVDSAGLTASKGQKFTAALVGAGLWHDGTTVDGCDSCADFLAKKGRRLSPGDVILHDFDDYQRLKDDLATPEQRLKDAQRMAMKRDTRLRGLIYARDEGLCRYCGFRVTTNPHDTRSGTRLTHDHIDPHAGLTDPDQGNNLGNVVLACAACNEAKGERTPDEAGMVLYVPGSTAHAIATGTATPFGDPDPSSVDERRIDDQSATEGGSGRVGTGSGPGRDPVGPGSTPGRSGRGSGRSRPGRAQPPKRARPP